MFKSSYTKEQFIEAIKTSKNMWEVMEKLGLKRIGGNYKVIIKKAERYNIDIGHLYGKVVRKSNPMLIITNEQIITAIKQSISFNSTIKSFGLDVNGSTNRWIRRKVIELQLDISHFMGQGHLGGKHHSNVQPVKSLEEICIKTEHGYQQMGRLKKRLIEEGYLKYECCNCGLGDMWNDMPITLQLDHINGDRTDNRIENLRILCPNCHTQTETYTWKNTKQNKVYKEQEEKLCKNCNKKIHRTNKSGYCGYCKFYKLEKIKTD